MLDLGFSTNTGAALGGSSEMQTLGSSAQGWGATSELVTPAPQMTLLSAQVENR